MIRRIVPVILLLIIVNTISAQSALDKIITPAEVERIEKTLSADDMQGRATFMPGIDKAATFIADEFKKAGLQPVKGDSYLQPFSMLKTKFISAKGQVNGKTIEEKNIVGITSKPSLSVSNTSGYEKIKVGAQEQMYAVLQKLMPTNKNYLLVVDTAQVRMFNSLKRRPSSFPSETNIIVLLTSEDPTTWSVEFKQDITPMALKNVVGILPGKKKNDEYVIFSGHYDHLGTGKPNAEGDTIFNGANDDAAGITAVIMLANYFAKQNNNERTIIFAAFTAEEIGGFGSRYFSQQFDPAKVMAMFNIEMIGTESKWGANSAYITGYEKTDMGKILEKNLEGTGFTFYPDPYREQNLFYRSDNATLARLGVPAHTISTSKMDSEKYYHTVDDEIGTLDMNNMAAIIRAIALSSTSIIAGKDTPSRVDTTQLR
jgi:hypothetical protein